MKKLKKLVCRGGVKNEIFLFYEKLKKSDEAINKEIAIDVQLTRDWSDEFGKEQAEFLGKMDMHRRL